MDTRADLTSEGSVTEQQLMTGLLVANCFRCGARKITFDVTMDTPVGFEHSSDVVDALEWEAFCVCRACERASIFIVRESYEAVARRRLEDCVARPCESDNAHVPQRAVSVADEATPPPPEHLPADVNRAFLEAAKCAKMGCFNAAGAMFRLCLDLATKDAPGHVLADRLGAVCKQRQFSPELWDLAWVLREEGNAAAHDGSLHREAVEDLQVFADRFLTQLYTEPTKVRAARERRETHKLRNKKTANTPRSSTAPSRE